MASKIIILIEKSKTILKKGLYISKKLSLKIATKSGIAAVMVLVVIVGSFTGIGVLSKDKKNTESTEQVGMAEALDSYFSGEEETADIEEYLAPTVAEAEEEVSFYDSVAIAQVGDSYVNVRSGPGTEYDIVGIINNNCAATINGEENGWYSITSGNVTGYILAEYFITGDLAEAKAREVGYVEATVTADVLNVRDGQSTDSAIVTSLMKGRECDVIEYGNGWVYLLVDGTLKGWVSMDYVTIDVSFETALTLEEQAKKVAEEAAQKALLAAQAAKQAAATSPAPTISYDYSYIDTADKAALRQAVVDFALKWVGVTPYSHGLSLENGTDCSGFTLLVYQTVCQMNLPRSSSAYGSVGMTVPLSVDSLLPGDILYSPGHVAIYIGNGQIVHARRQGIRVSVQSWTVCSWSSARRVIT